MARTPPDGTPRITPYLLYEDCATAIDWLSEAFGFREILRFTDENGIVTHAELRLDDGLVFIGHPGPGPAAGLCSCAGRKATPGARAGLTFGPWQISSPRFASGSRTPSPARRSARPGCRRRTPWLRCGSTCPLGATRGSGGSSAGR